MTCSNAFWCTMFTFFFVFFSFTRAEISLRNFSGVWFALFEEPTVNFFTPQGQGLVCRDVVSPECEEELTLADITYTFNSTSLSFEVRDRIGVTTTERSAALHPSCAEDGILPAERTLSIPPGRILSYDSKTERIFYIDPRRPDEVNCVLARYRIGEKGPYIEMTHVLTYQGPISALASTGFSFSCEIPPCSVEVDAATGELNANITNIFTLTCIAGDCLNAPTALASSVSHDKNESPVDV